MLPHYSALKVAEQFRVLDAIAPGRIDLGLGRAPGSDGRTAYALNPRADTAADNFPPTCATCWPGWRGRSWWRGTRSAISAPSPSGPTRPEVWILGSSDYGAQVAAYFGLPFCFAHFITDGRGVEQALAMYREGYRPSAAHPAPHAAICVWAMAAETQDEAALSVPVARDMAAEPRPRRVHAPCRRPRRPPPHACSEGEQARIERLRARSLYGTPDVVAAKLRALAAEHQVEEIAILTTLHDPEARRRSYTLLAKEMMRRYGRQRFALAAE